MKIYTRTGDQGTTSLFGGSRVAKCDMRIAAYGTIDELNAALGIVRAMTPPANVDKIVARLQGQLFQLGAELASPVAETDHAEKLANTTLQQSDVDELERAIDTCESGLPPLKAFILPGGTPVAAQLHLARCVCRRAEREIVALAENASVRETALKYVNRAGDLLFVLARAANAAAGVAETEWKPRR